MSIKVSVGIPPFPPIPEQFLECIDVLTVVSNCQDVDFSGLDSSVDVAYLMLARLKNAAGVVANYFVYVNDDYTDANYRSEYVEGAGAVCTVSGTATPNFAGLSAGRCMNTRLEIHPDVANKPRFITHSNRYNIAAELSILMRNAGYNIAGDITTLRIHSDQATGIGEGSKIFLYRYKSL
jgi:hypothetical protein